VALSARIGGIGAGLSGFRSEWCWWCLSNGLVWVAAQSLIT